MDIAEPCQKLGLSEASLEGGDLRVTSPIDGSRIASVESADASEVGAAIGRAREAFLDWRSVPGPGAAA